MNKLKISILSFWSFPQCWGSWLYVNLLHSVRFCAICTAPCIWPPVTSLSWSTHLAGALPLARFPSICPRIVSFSRLCNEDRIMCPKKLRILSWHIVSRRLVTFSSSRMETLVLIAVQGMRSSFLQQYISNASIFLRSFFLRHQVSTLIYILLFILNKKNSYSQFF